MPEELKSAGYNHFGDPDYIGDGPDGYLFVPVEHSDDDGNPVLAVFRDNRRGGRLTYLGSHPLTCQTAQLGTPRAGWCALHPRSHQLHSSGNQIDGDSHVFRYNINRQALRQGDLWLTPTTTLKLWHNPTDYVRITKNYIQGGTFLPDGRLVLAVGKVKPLQSDQSVRVLWDLRDDGQQLERSFRGPECRSRTLGGSNPGRTTFQESERLCYSDVRQVNGAQTDIGQVHATCDTFYGGKTSSGASTTGSTRCRHRSRGRSGRHTPRR